MSSLTTLDSTRRIVLQHGWNATCYQLVNPRLNHWFPVEENAVVGYVHQYGVWVVAGAPVCSRDHLLEVIGLYEQQAQEHRRRVCYFGASYRLLDVIGLKSGYSRVVLGAQPVWTPGSLLNAFSRTASLRAQLNRARNKGVIVREWTVEEATVSEELQRCLNEWLDTRGLPPLHFLVEPDTLSNLEGRRIFVAEREGSVVGFMVLAPIPERQGWLTEQFPRSHNAPNGTVELLLHAAAEVVEAEGAQYFTMGLVPLSKRSGADEDYNPKWLKFVSRWVRAHGRRFYNFDGLEFFKSKFQPDSWEPIFAISNEPKFSLRSLHAIAAAFADGPPIIAILKGMGRALRQEVRWLLKKANP